MVSQHLLIAKRVNGGAIVTIGELDPSERGLACECECWHCGGRLVARIGKQKRHHFAHHRTADEDPRCGESALHLLGKWLITRMSCLPLPSIEANSHRLVGRYGAVLQSPEHALFGEVSPLSIVTVAEEVSLESGSRADLLVTGEESGHPLPVAVEIKVTHAVDDEKLERLVAQDLTTVEIDLSEVYRAGRYTIGDVERALQQPTNQRFLHCSADLVEWAAGGDRTKQWLALERQLSEAVNALGEAASSGTLMLPALPGPPAWVRSRYGDVVDLPSPSPMPVTARGARGLSVRQLQANRLEVEAEEWPTPMPLLLTVPGHELAESPARFFEGCLAFLEVPVTEDSDHSEIAWGNHPEHEAWSKAQSARIDQVVREAEILVEARSAEHVARLDATLRPWLAVQPITLPPSSPASFGLHEGSVVEAMEITGAVMPEIPRVHQVEAFERTGANSFRLTVTGGAVLTLLVINEVLLDGFLDRPAGGSWVWIDFVDLVQISTAKEMIDALHWGGSVKVDRWVDDLLCRAAEREFPEMISVGTVLPNRLNLLGDLYRAGIRLTDWNYLYVAGLDFHRTFAASATDWQLGVVHALIYRRTPPLKDYPAWMVLLQRHYSLRPTPRDRRPKERMNPYRTLGMYLDHLSRRCRSGGVVEKPWAAIMREGLTTRYARRHGWRQYLG